MNLRKILPTDPAFQPFHPYGQMKKCAEFYGHATIDWNGDWYTCCFPSDMKEYKLGQSGVRRFLVGLER